MHQLFILVFRLLGIAVGMFLLAIGAPLLVTPIPLGLLLIVLGTAILLASSVQARNWVRRRRQTDKSFDAGLRRFEERMPGPLRALLVSTRPPDQT